MSFLMSKITILIAGGFAGLGSSRKHSLVSESPTYAIDFEYHRALNLWNYLSDYGDDS